MGLTVRRAFGVAVAVAACGCSGTKALDSIGSANSEQPAAVVRAPDFSGSSKVALLHDGSTLETGDDWHKASDVFPQPAKADAVDELPPTLKPPFRARGWETANGGFAAILSNDRIAVAMYQVEKADEDEFQTIVAAHVSEMSGIVPTRIDQPKVRFWFWDDGRRRTMVGAIQTGKAELTVTVATGDDGVCDAVGISDSAVRLDASKAESLLELPPEPASNKSSNKR